ncbi:RND transporter MFP subunit [Alphaproteobacteria bacterium]|nr:RND transporter MFP subunit [Alphaproteobacteria bacterium]
MTIRGIMLGLAMLAVGGFTGCDKAQDAPPAPREATVAVYQASVKPLAARARYSGFVEGFITVEAVSRVNGFILKKNFESGQQVKAGQVLFEIEPYQYDAAVKAAAADLAKARAALVQATNEEKRQSRLLKSGDVAASAYDVAKAGKDAAAAAVMQAEANLRNAELNLSYTKITATTDGAVSDSNFDVGNMVSPSSGVLTTVVDADPVFVRFGVSDAQLARLMQTAGARSADDLKSALTASLLFENGRAYPISGKLSFVDVLMDKTTGTLLMKASFPNPDGALLPGQYVGVELTTKARAPKVLVPTVAIGQGQAGTTVSVFKDGAVALRPVVLGDADGSMTVIESGVAAGEQIVVEGAAGVRPGMAVKSRPWEAHALPDADKGLETEPAPPPAAAPKPPAAAPAAKGAR